jgi:hypothetical protein
MEVIMTRSSGFFRLAIFLFIFCFLICCGSKQDDVEAKLFSLEKQLTVDTENNEIAEMGLTDIRHFDIDSEGDIFIANPKAKENFIFILDKVGNIKSAFGAQGQGPGELQSPLELVVSTNDEIFITERGKVVVFSNTGQFIKDFHIDSEYQRVIPLNADRYLVIAVKLNDDFSQSFQVLLCSSGMEELKTLDSSKIESFKKAVKVNIIPTLVVWGKSDSQVLTGHTDKYEIRVFDFNGQLLKSIEKEYDPVLLSDRDRARYEKNLERYPPDIRGSFFIPDAFPPIRSIVALGDEWLFCQTYEPGNEGNSVYDIFDANGEFVGKTELEGYQVKFKGDRVYCLKQKESGYRELVVYRMIWAE